MLLQKDLREFIELLHSHGVEFIVVGAHALAFHGYPRYTGDLDLFIRRDLTNAAKLDRVMKDFGFGETGLSADDYMAENQVIQLGIAPNRIDLLTSLTGVEFKDAWEHKVSGYLDEGLEVFYIGREDLLENKRTLGRKRDLADVEELER